MRLLKLFMIVFVCASLLSSVAPVSAQAAADGYTHPPTGLVFPRNIGRTVYTQTHQFEDPRLGVAVQYQGMDIPARIGIYLYDLGLKNIGTGLGQVAREQFAQAKEDIYIVQQRGRYQQVQTLFDKQFELQSGKGPLPALAACFLYDMEGTRYTSFLVVTEFKGSVFKVRYTYPSQAAQTGDKQFEQFLNDLSPILK